MRTPEQIRDNAAKILASICTIDAQLGLLAEEYQPNAVEMTGELNPLFTTITENLKDARSSLNTLWHMEIDLADNIEYGDD